jgi:thiol-disulfide isomerase/thioredoxin
LKESLVTRSLFAGLALLIGAVSGVGVNPQEKLKVGDPAPALKVSSWLHGAEVKALEPGKVYVVEFWATWCGPCIQMMPHLGDIQEEYRAKGVTVIGFTSEGTDVEAKVLKFVEKRGAKLGYTFAFAKDQVTNDAYMKAAGQNGIPCSYVVNKEGKIAYIGHPLFLDVVLPKVVDGTWDMKSGADEIAAADKDFDAAFEAVDKATGPEAGLKILADFAAKWPGLAGNPYMTKLKFSQMVKAKKFAEVKELGEKLITKAAKRGDTLGLMQVSAALRDDAAKGQAEMAALSVRAAETAYAADDKNPSVVLALVESYQAAGNSAKAKEYGPKAVAAATAALDGDRDAIGTLRIAAAQLASGDKEQAKVAAERAIGMVDLSNAGLRRYVEQEAAKFGAEPRKDEKKSNK